MKFDVVSETRRQSPSKRESPTGELMKMGFCQLFVCWGRRRGWAALSLTNLQNQFTISSFSCFVSYAVTAPASAAVHPAR